ncbi:hypothetical protein CRG98_008802 [Punica granatum]|uniref:Uncharacterized protein n=1 Tax=Punica granatum TaxID=22663 RepID=A0A2I0KQQ4_PUNGR|nr:hypothetical protein CRG98_008802 [Punica granatum]
MEQVSDCLSEFNLVSRVDPNLEKRTLSNGIFCSELIRENVDIRALHHPLPITPKGYEINSVWTKQVIPISRVTFQWSRTPPDKPSGLIFDKRRSQWSPNTSEHSRNTEKAPFADS